MKLSTHKPLPFVPHLLIWLILIGSLLNASRAQESAHSPGWVVISIEQYRELRSKAFPTEIVPAPTVEATLTRVDYELHVNGDSATGQATLTVDVLTEGWVRIPVPPGLLVREAQLDGKRLPLALEANGKNGGQLSALLSHPGRSVLMLNIAVPVTSAAASENISLPTTASGITRASIQLSRPDIDVSVSGGLLSQTSPAESREQMDGLRQRHRTSQLYLAENRSSSQHPAVAPARLAHRASQPGRGLDQYFS